MRKGADDDPGQEADDGRGHQVAVERSSLNAEIDRVLAEITEKIGGNAC